MKFTSVIVEDLKVAADYLNNCCLKSGNVEVRDIFSAIEPAYKYLSENRVDLVFLDVEMPGGTGFELLDKLAYKPEVILTTSKAEYAFNAFEYRVIDFLKKPFTYQRFVDAIQKLEQASISRPSKNEDAIYIRCDGRLVRLHNSEILFIESMGDYVRFVTADKKFVTHNTIKNLEEKVDKNLFMKVHRSYIININKIDDIRENDLYIRGIEIPISKAHKPEVLKRLNIL